MYNKLLDKLVLVKSDKNTYSIYNHDFQLLVSSLPSNFNIPFEHMKLFAFGKELNIKRIAISSPKNSKKSVKRWLIRLINSIRPSVNNTDHINDCELYQVEKLMFKSAFTITDYFSDNIYIIEIKANAILLIDTTSCEPMIIYMCNNHILYQSNLLDKYFMNIIINSL